jgi:hypothetical protein
MKIIDAIAILKLKLDINERVERLLTNKGKKFAKMS